MKREGSTVPFFPCISINFLAGNGMLGFFNTGLHKVIHIENLKLAFFKYPEKKRRSRMPRPLRTHQD